MELNTSVPTKKELEYTRFMDAINEGTIKVFRCHISKTYKASGILYMRQGGLDE